MALQGSNTPDLSYAVTGTRWWATISSLLVLIYQITLAVVINYIVTTTITKISILCFYCRITGAVAHKIIYCKSIPHTVYTEEDANFWSKTRDLG